MRKIELRSMAALLCMNFVVQFVAFPRKSCVAQHADEGQSGIQIEIQLDSQDVLFGDPIYGFVSIKNISGQERFVRNLGVRLSS